MRRDLARHDSIETEAAEDGTCDEIPLRREVRPGAEQWQEV